MDKQIRNIHCARYVRRLDTTVTANIASLIKTNSGPNNPHFSYLVCLKAVSVAQISDEVTVVRGFPVAIGENDGGGKQLPKPA